MSTPTIAAATMPRARRLTPLTTAEAITNDAASRRAPANGTIVERLLAREAGRRSR